MNQKGFSILEILISLLILSLLATITVQAFVNFRTNIAIQTEIEDIMSLLERARIQTTSSYEDSQYGVHVESSRLVFFKGATFAEPQTGNEEFILDQSVSINEINLNGGGNDIVFQRLTGNTSAYGTLVIEAITNTSTTRTINIYQNGTIDLN